LIAQSSGRAAPELARARPHYACRCWSFGIRRKGDVSLVKSHKGFDAQFARFASHVASWAGRPTSVAGAIIIVVIWAVSGPFFGFSDFWQLTINTGTTIVTFLMVFIIQNTQNRDSRAVQIKLDELIRATTQAHNSLLDLEELTEADLEKFRKHYCRLASHARKHGFDSGEMLAELEAEEKALELKRREEERVKRRKDAQRQSHKETEKA